MPHNSAGQPDQNGRFQLIDGVLKPRRQIEEGDYIGFDMALVDAASGSRVFLTDAKAEPPKSIDEALKQQFKLLAERDRTTVSEWLAKKPQKDIEEIASQVAAQYISAQAGAGVAAQYAKDSAMLTDADRAEINYRVAAAKDKHDLARASRPHLPVFDEAAAFSDAVSVKTAETARRMVFDSSGDAQRLADEAEGARIARKHQISNAWRS